MTRWPEDGKEVFIEPEQKNVYVRVVLAVPDSHVPSLMKALDEFIETDDVEFAVNPIVGAYISTPYPTREDACGKDWKE